MFYLKINHVFQNDVKFSSFTFVREKAVDYFPEVIVVIYLIDVHIVKLFFVSLK